MSYFTRNHTAREILKTEKMKEHLPVFVPHSIIDSIPEEFMDKKLSELADLLTMPWGDPFIPEILIDGAEFVLELNKNKRFSFFPLWSEDENYGIPDIVKNDKDSVCLMQINDHKALKEAEIRPAAIVCPGGGYVLEAVQNEGIEFAEKLEEAGYAAYVLMYRVDPNRYPEPQKDLALAIKYLRANAQKLRIDPDRILIMGSSAAGHLCASETVYHEEIGASLMEDLRRDQPDLAAKYEGISVKADRVGLVYPVIDFLQYPHEGSFQALTGGDESLRDKLSVWKHVTKEFPRTYVWANRDDETVPYENSVLMADALAKRGVGVTLQIFPQGGHGCGLGRGLSCEGWIDVMPQTLQ